MTASEEMSARSVRLADRQIDAWTRLKRILRKSKRQSRGRKSELLLMNAAVSGVSFPQLNSSISMKFTYFSRNGSRRKPVALSSSSTVERYTNSVYFGKRYEGLPAPPRKWEAHESNKFQTRQLFRGIVSPERYTFKISRVAWCKTQNSNTYLKLFRKCEKNFSWS